MGLPSSHPFLPLLRSRRYPPSETVVTPPSERPLGVMYDPMSTVMYDPPDPVMYDPLSTVMYDPPDPVMYDPLSTVIYDPQKPFPRTVHNRSSAPFITVPPYRS